MKRRAFITLLGGAAASWPFAGARSSRTGCGGSDCYTFAADDPEGQARNAALLQALQPLGWTVGRNLRIDYRWGQGDAASTRKNAADLVALAPDLILTNGAAGVGPLLEVTVLCQSCLSWSPIRLAPALSIVWHVRVAMPPASLRSNTASGANGSNCSRRSRRP